MIRETPTSFRFVSQAEVYKNGVLAGQIARDRSGFIHFTYLSDYDGPPVSTTLPREGPDPHYIGPGLPAFFAGLLPEGYRLELLRSSLKTSADDELSILLAVGSNLPGDVQVLRHGDRPKQLEPELQHNAEDFSSMDFMELFNVVDTVGLPGAQPKVSSAMLTIPVETVSASSILKLNPPRFPLLVQNEKLHLDAARLLKLPVAKSRLVYDRNNEAGLLLERFDRFVDGERLHRRALEDGAQVLNILPAQKYSVHTEDLVRAVASRTTAPRVATRNLFLQFFFAWLTGNGDLHAKNVSILETIPTRWEVAPIYDIPCTAVFRPCTAVFRDFEMALPIDGRLKGIKSKHWVAFVHDIGLPVRAARAAVNLALNASSTVNLSALGYTGSPLNGANREISHRQQEATKLLEDLR